MRFAVTVNALLKALAAGLDRDDVAMAATWRAVGRAAENLGLRRPSYDTVRRLVIIERRRRRGAHALSRAAGRAVRRIRLSARVDCSIALERRSDTRDELVLQRYKRPRAPTPTNARARP